MKKRKITLFEKKATQLKYFKVPIPRVHCVANKMCKRRSCCSFLAGKKSSASSFVCFMDSWVLPACLPAAHAYYSHTRRRITNLLQTIKIIGQFFSVCESEPRNLNILAESTNRAGTAAVSPRLRQN